MEREGSGSDLPACSAPRALYEGVHLCGREPGPPWEGRSACAGGDSRSKVRPVQTHARRAKRGGVHDLSPPGRGSSRDEGGFESAVTLSLPNPRPVRSAVPEVGDQDAHGERGREASNEHRAVRAWFGV